jgi:hypothetical protein
MKNTEKILQNTIERCREKHIIIPTYKQMRNPELIPEKIKNKLKNIGLWDLNSLNLFRITWKNEPVEFGGGYGDVNFIEIPPELSGVKARIIVLIGKFFPTGANCAYILIAVATLGGEFCDAHIDHPLITH